MIPMLNNLDCLSALKLAPLGLPQIQVKYHKTNFVRDFVWLSSFPLHKVTCRLRAFWRVQIDGKFNFNFFLNALDGKVKVGEFPISADQDMEPPEMEPTAPLRRYNPVGFIFKWRKMLLFSKKITYYYCHFYLPSVFSDRLLYFALPWLDCCPLFTNRPISMNTWKISVRTRICFVQLFSLFRK